MANRDAARIRADGKWKSRANALIKDEWRVREIDNQLVESFAGVARKRDREKGGTGRAVIGGISVGGYVHGGSAVGCSGRANIWIEIVREHRLFHERSNLIGCARTWPAGGVEDQRSNRSGGWRGSTRSEEVRKTVVIEIGTTEERPIHAIGRTKFRFLPNIRIDQSIAIGIKIKRDAAARRTETFKRWSIGTGRRIQHAGIIIRRELGPGIVFVSADSIGIRCGRMTEDRYGTVGNIRTGN